MVRVRKRSRGAAPRRSEVVLITGGGSGIGAGLAEAFHARGAQVIVAGHRRERVEQVASRCAGMRWEVVDVSDFAQVTALAERITDHGGGLDTVISNAGVQHLFDFTASQTLDATLLAREVDVNLTGVVNVAAAFLPLLQGRPAARLVHVGSGLGYIPLAAAPVYSATKAAVHAFTLSLRRQFAESPVQIVELIPPAVVTDLHRHLDELPPKAMDVDTFVRSAMAALDDGRDEIVVGLARVLKMFNRIAPKVGMSLVNRQT